jgi:CRISPR/Cas system CSM-associated protein Csm3 (group 7 of RAMP superfamily)
MTRRIHALFWPLVFPAGIAAGESGDYNLLRLARDGVRRPVLRGSALAGALRHAWGRYLARTGLRGAELVDKIRQFFGYALGDAAADNQDSPLQVSDCLLDTGQAGVVTRTHNLRDRHSGTVADGGLFSLETCPPQTRTTAALWLRDDAPQNDAARGLLTTLTAFVRRGLPLGGKTARGIGLTRLAGPPMYRVYDLSQIADYAAWLDDDRAWRVDKSRLPVGQSLPESAAADAPPVLTVEFGLGIPRGQDLLVGDGQGLDHEMEPQRVVQADGRLYWRLPGSSLRGLFRGWVARLAARENRPVADSVQRHQARQAKLRRGEKLTHSERLNGANLGWCFLPEEDRRPGKARTDCCVAALFGSLFQAGRLQISDAYAPCSAGKQDGGNLPREEQLRKHVAVDRITGGAAESMLFENTVLTAEAQDLQDHGFRSPRFQVRMQVESPSPDEARWLAQAIKALDLGILRVGSSKSSGRLSLAEPPQASGPGAEFFSALKPHFGPEAFVRETITAPQA